MNEAEPMVRLADALESVAAEMERLRLLKEYELGVQIMDSEGAPYVREEGIEE
jgi:hypothetical protein